jgi:uncharacterized membrane protein YozB (DUF420 family)
MATKKAARKKATGNTGIPTHTKSQFGSPLSKGDLMKVLLGGATLLPFLYMIIFMGFMISAFGLSFSSDAPMPQINLPILFAVHLIVGILSVGLIVFYIVNVFKNERVDKDKKAVWAVVLIMGGIIAMPIYWYLYFWKDEQIGD